eukprot:TRINITY_DN70034_c0_g1_i1.p1 TRINITY_DN70034_c0_g1~~TRINITY_DN70034_c0_g1_i1.p1  ORF type:complete len:450 (+),score=97.23 TRINITY_DN70034_c0_g1_i1:77-1426(+)
MPQPGAVPPLLAPPDWQLLVIINCGEHAGGGGDPPQADPPLSECGAAAAQAAAQAVRQLRPRPKGYSALYSSPWLCALQTAAAVGQATSLKVRPEPGMSDLLPAGCAPTNPLSKLLLRTEPAAAYAAADKQLDLTYVPAVEPLWPEPALPRRHDTAARSPMLRRFRRAADFATGSGDAEGGGSVIIVSHGSAHDFFPAAVCGDASFPPEWRSPAAVAPCSITVLARADPSAPWVVERLAGPVPPAAPGRAPLQWRGVVRAPPEARPPAELLKRHEEQLSELHKLARTLESHTGGSSLLGICDADEVQEYSAAVRPLGDLQRKAQAQASYDFRPPALLRGLSAEQGAPVVLLRVSAFEWVQPVTASLKCLRYVQEDTPEDAPDCVLLSAADRGVSLLLGPEWCVARRVRVPGGEGSLSPRRQRLLEHRAAPPRWDKYAAGGFFGEAPVAP